MLNVYKQIEDALLEFKEGRVPISTGKVTLEVDYADLSQLISVLYAQKKYEETMEKCLMEGFEIS